MQARTASLVAVVINVPTRHLHQLTGGVIEGSRVDILEVALNTLECKEISIGSNRCGKMIKKVVQRFPRFVGRILHQVVKELSPIGWVSTFINYSKQLPRKAVVYCHALIHYFIIFHCNCTKGKLVKYSRCIKKLKEGILVVIVGTLKVLNKFVPTNIG